MSPEEGTPVALYARVSTQEQSRDGVSIDMQVARMRAYAEAHGLRIAEVVIDAGHSAKTLNRPGIERMRQLIDQREIAGIVVFKLDRLTRSVVDFGNLLSELESARVALMSVRDSLDTGSAAGRLVTNIMVSVSQWEREAIGERTADALARTKERGTYLGQPPVGFKVEDGKLVKTERYALVERAVSMRAEGMTLSQIAATFDREGIPTGSGSGRWYPASVGRLLKAAAIAA